MRIPKVINWNGFLGTITQPSRSKQESCAWIFADIQTDYWEIFEVKNIGLKYRGDTVEERVRSSFAPDKKDFAKIKRKARKLGLTKIGNVHTHVVIGSDPNELEYQFRPSEPDLKYAKKYNDIVRAVIVVSFPLSLIRPYPHCVENGKIYGIVWFDQYGKILKREKY